MDGQQRLAAIRDFIADLITIDGEIEPKNQKIKEFNGLTFSELSPIEQRKIKKYGITVIRLTEYFPDEPSELFFRLNQPLVLTSAERRNSYIGVTRNQIKKLVENFEVNGASKDTIGFSNSRMAYDDVVSKLCYVFEINTLRKKITSNNISERYRLEKPFSEAIIKHVDYVLSCFINSIKSVKKDFETKLNINKATLYSWLIFTYTNKDFLSNKQLGELIYTFEYTREYIKGKRDSVPNEKIKNLLEFNKQLSQMVLMFNQKASMGSTDVNSIIYRDIILEIFLVKYFENEVEDPYRLIEYLTDESASVGRILEMISEGYEWGEVLIDGN